MSTERDILQRIAAIANVRSGTLVGIGDDAAVLEGDPQTVIALDVVVDGVHFSRSTSRPGDIGHQALAVNLSDIAAMGARPVAAFVGLSLPRDNELSLDDVDEMYRGMESLAASHGVTIAGGDVTMASELSLAVTVVGRLPEDRAPVLRSGAQPGDLLCVTGSLGAAAAGLLILQGDVAPGVTPDGDLLAARLRRPIPRVAEGIALAGAEVSAMMDCSDGLALDVSRMALSSEVTIRLDLELVPVADGVAEVAETAGRHADLLAATGGDDYELIVTVAPERLQQAQATIAPIPLTPIGQVTAGSGELVVVRGDAPARLTSLGYEHRGREEGQATAS